MRSLITCISHYSVLPSGFAVVLSTLPCLCAARGGVRALRDLHDSAHTSTHHPLAIQWTLSRVEQCSKAQLPLSSATSITGSWGTVRPNSEHNSWQACSWGQITRRSGLLYCVRRGFISFFKYGRHSAWKFRHAMNRPPNHRSTTATAAC